MRSTILRMLLTSVILRRTLITVWSLRSPTPITYAPLLPCSISLRPAPKSISIWSSSKDSSGNERFDVDPRQETTKTSSSHRRRSKKAGRGFGNDDVTKDVLTTNMPSSSRPDPSVVSSLKSSQDEDIAALSSPEERTKAILRNQYGMKTSAEQEASQQASRIIKDRMIQQKELAEKFRSQQQQLNDLDLNKMLSPSAISAIDKFLKLGLSISVLTFVTAGILITLEAGNAAMKLEQTLHGTSGSNTLNEAGFLPESWSVFITQAIQPSFTPGLFILLGFSIALGLFSTVQMGSASANYVEGRSKKDADEG
jgi:hypothetical protein